MIDLFYNLKKYSVGESKIAFVVGLPESGKTEMIKGVFKENDETIQYINANDLYDLWSMGDDIENQPELVSSFYENMIKWIFPVENSAFMRESIIDRDVYKRRVLELFLRWCKLHGTQSRVVVESTDLLTLNINPNVFKAYDFTLVVLGANALKCAKQHANYMTDKKLKRLFLTLKFFVKTDQRTIRGLHDYQIFCMDNDTIECDI